MSGKHCYSCGYHKELDEFCVNKTKKDGHDGICKECRSVYNKGHYRHTKGKYVKSRSEARAVRQERNRDWIVNYLKEHPCVDCGEDDIVVLEFDHQRDKVANVSSLHNYSSLQRIIEEVAKCEVVCSNCHARRTAVKFNYFKTRVI